MYRGRPMRMGLLAGSGMMMRRRGAYTCVSVWDEGQPGAGLHDGGAGVVLLWEQALRI